MTRKSNRASFTVDLIVRKERRTAETAVPPGKPMANEREIAAGVTEQRRASAEAQGWSSLQKKDVCWNWYSCTR